MRPRPWWWCTPMTPTCTAVRRSSGPECRWPPVCRCSAERGRTSPPSGSACSAWTSSATSTRSEEHTSELQSRFELVCRLLLEKKNNEVLHNVLEIHTVYKANSHVVV